jgi:hypothetical protein
MAEQGDSCLSILKGELEGKKISEDDVCRFIRQKHDETYLESIPKMVFDKYISFIQTTSIKCPQSWYNRLIYSEH